MVMLGTYTPGSPEWHAARRWRIGGSEIGQIMDIKLPTVKTHVSHILDKLDVRRRSEAKTAAKRLRLIPEQR